MAQPIFGFILIFPQMITKMSLCCGRNHKNRHEKVFGLCDRLLANKEMMSSISIEC